MKKIMKQLFFTFYSFFTLHLSLIADTTDALNSSSTTGTGTNAESGADGANACCGRPGATAIG